MFKGSLFYLKSNISKLLIALIPTGFFAYNSQEVLIIQLLFIVLAIDVFLGIGVAIKLRRFSSHSMGRVIPKLIAYISVIILTTVLSKMFTQVGLLFYGTVSFFVIREISSNLEKLALLGIKMPVQVLKLLNSDYVDKESAEKVWQEKNKKLF